MVGSTPWDPVGFTTVALGDVTPTATVQEPDCWLQDSKEFETNMKEPLLFLLEWEESNWASKHWDPMACEL
jgi:hypothetical protein